MRNKNKTAPRMAEGALRLKKLVLNEQRDLVIYLVRLLVRERLEEICR